jgi:hypothetical protein
MKFTSPMLLLGVVMIGVAVSGVALAETYQTEVSVGATRIDSNGVDSKLNGYNLQGTYHFNAVTTTNLPLAEAAYLGKNSSVFADITDFPRQHGYPSSQQYAVGAQFFIPEQFLYVKAGAWRSESSSNHKNSWFTTVGLMPIEGLLLTTDYNHDDGYDANINAKYVTEIGGQFVNLEAGVVDTDWGTTFNLGGDYYIDNTFSVGGKIVDNDYGNEYTLRTRKFFSESFSGDLSYIDSKNGNVVKAGLALRF